MPFARASQRTIGRIVRAQAPQCSLWYGTVRDGRALMVASARIMSQGHVDDVDSRAQPEQLGRDMRQAAVSRGPVIELAGYLLRSGDEILDQSGIFP
jgi:hypothetical protein